MTTHSGLSTDIPNQGAMVNRTSNPNFPARPGVLAVLCVGFVLAFACLVAPTANADFGIHDFDVTYTEADGTPAEAGSHPFAVTTYFGTNIDGDLVPEGWLRDFIAGLPPGFVGDTTAYPTCSAAAFLAFRPTGEQTENLGEPNCPLETQVGVIGASIGSAGRWTVQPLFNVTPPPGVLLRIGFRIGSENIFVDAGISQAPPYNAIGASYNTPQLLNVYGSAVQLWGDPSDPRHDELRGGCGHQETDLPPDEVLSFKFLPTGLTCPVGDNPRPFLTMPTQCSSPLAATYDAVSWNDIDGDGKPETDSGNVLAPALRGCGKLGFKPSITAQPTTRAAQSPTGLDFALEVADEGLVSTNEGARSQSAIRRVEVTLPIGMSANPSLAEGLEVCSETDLANETLHSAPGVGCPQASKIGSLEVETPLVAEPIRGSLYQATPYENLAGDALLAFYIVFKNPRLGIIVKQPAEVVSDPHTGQLTTITDEIPQLPFSSFRLHFREGARSPLVSPPTCGSHNVAATLFPWSGGPPIETTSAFQIISGPDAGPCPSGGLPPFKPGLTAGTLNNAAGRFSPFNLRLSRTDSEQEFTRFSIKLPPGIVGKLAGIPYCSDAAIAAAKARTGPHGGAEELASPSCPAASEIGRTLAGAGVGPSLAYAPGKIYLAGPYNGSNLSMVAITAGVVGPFDIGTVVIRQAFKIDPESAEVFVDSTGSDPIPHIIKGIPVHLRDIRAYVDRPNFVLNPTDCTRTSTASTLLGSGLDFGSAIDDRPVTVSTPFQAADCAALPFKPRLRLELKGGTKRSQNPALIARLNMNGIGEAGIGRAQVTLPHSEFLDQAHIRTICTRVQFRAGAGNGAECPAGSIYGKARATTPILAEPLSGPVILRSSENPLPDLVAALSNSQVDFNLVGRIDSVKGQIRNTFETAPDAPVSSFVLEMRGGKKGLLENSTDLCEGTHRAIADFTGQNGKRHKFKPKLQAKCPKARKGKGKKKGSPRQGRR